MKSTHCVNNHLEDALPVNASNGSVIRRPIVQRATQRIIHATFIHNTLNVASLGTKSWKSMFFANILPQDPDTDVYVTRCVSSGCINWIQDPFAVCKYSESKRDITYPDSNCSEINHPCKTYVQYPQCSPKWLALIGKYVYIIFFTILIIH